MSTPPIQAIPDLHIGRAYDQRDPECDIHYETFGRLAEFFGRNTPAHRHYCFFQVHVLVRGSIRLNLDDTVYEGHAPLIIFTPPTIAHAFYSEEGTDGHVITIRQEVVRAWLRTLSASWSQTLLRRAAFFEITHLPPEHSTDFDALLKTVDLLHHEYHRDTQARTALVRALGEGVFIHLCRLLQANEPMAAQRPERSEDLRLFMQFCDLIEAHFRDHLTLTEYAARLQITEARLNDICRRMAQRPSKEVVHERLLQEARRLLQLSATPVNEISYQLGFTDPAYFSRFFTKRTGTPPSQFRMMGQG